MNRRFVLLSIFASICLALFSSSNGQLCEADFSNYVPDIVVVQAATKEYPHLANYATEHMPTILDRLQKEFSGARLGLATFSDKGYETWESKTQAYHVWSPLTAKKETLLSNIANITACEDCGGHFPDASLVAIAAAVQDKTLRWSDDLFTARGKRIVSSVVLRTNADPLMEGDQKSSHLGNYMHNDLPTLGASMSQHDVYLLGLIDAPGQAAWSSHLKAMTGGRGIIQNMPGAKPSDADGNAMADLIIDGIKKFICQYFEGPDEGDKSQKKEDSCTVTVTIEDPGVFESRATLPLSVTETFDKIPYPSPSIYTTHFGMETAPITAVYSNFVARGRDHHGGAGGGGGYMEASAAHPISVKLTPMEEDVLSYFGSMLSDADRDNQVQFDLNDNTTYIWTAHELVKKLKKRRAYKGNPTYPNAHKSNKDFVYVHWFFQHCSYRGLIISGMAGSAAPLYMDNHTFGRKSKVVGEVVSVWKRPDGELDRHSADLLLKMDETEEPMKIAMDSQAVDQVLNQLEASQAALTADRGAIETIGATKQHDAREQESEIEQGEDENREEEDRDDSADENGMDLNMDFSEEPISAPEEMNDEALGEFFSSLSAEYDPQEDRIEDRSEEDDAVETSQRHATKQRHAAEQESEREQGEDENREEEDRDDSADEKEMDLNMDFSEEPTSAPEEMNDEALGAFFSSLSTEYDPQEDRIEDRSEDEDDAFETSESQRQATKQRHAAEQESEREQGEGEDEDGTVERLVSTTSRNKSARWTEG